MSLRLAGALIQQRDEAIDRIERPGFHFILDVVFGSVRAFFLGGLYAGGAIVAARLLGVAI